MYLAMDGTFVDTQPWRERSYAGPVIYFILFIICGTMFAANIFVGVVIDEFQELRVRVPATACACARVW